MPVHRAGVGTTVTSGEITFPIDKDFAATTDDALRFGVTGDTNDRFVVNANGVLEWGSGAAAPETNLYRVGAYILKTGGNLSAVGYLETLDNIYARGNLYFGLADDTILYSSAADTLTTDDDFLINTAGKGLKWIAGNEQTTVGAAGAGSLLPVSPTKYLKVKDSAGTTLVVPAFAAS